MIWFFSLELAFKVVTTLEMFLNSVYLTHQQSLQYISQMYKSTLMHRTHSYLHFLFNPCKVVLDNVECFWSHFFQFAVDLLVLHQTSVTGRPQTPRVRINHVGKKQLLYIQQPVSSRSRWWWWWITTSITSASRQQQVTATTHRNSGSQTDWTVLVGQRCHRGRNRSFAISISRL